MYRNIVIFVFLYIFLKLIHLGYKKTFRRRKKFSEDDGVIVPPNKWECVIIGLYFQLFDEVKSCHINKKLSKIINEIYLRKIGDSETKEERSHHVRRTIKLVMFLINICLFIIRMHEIFFSDIYELQRFFCML